MIAKGNLHAHGGKLAAYLQTGKDGERAEVIETRGFLDDDLREGFRQVQVMAAQVTKCEKPFFHAYVRLPEGEGIERDTWLQIADRMEKELGFTGQPRAVAFHVAPDGDRHLHVAWSRVDFEREKAIDPGLFKLKLKNLCRDMEVDYGLQQVANDRGPEQPKAAKRPEFEEARRHRVEIDETRQVIRDCYSRTQDGPGFMAALAAEGMRLAQGDRRDFVVLDEAGGKHALGKPLCGEPAAAIRQKLGEAFKAELPTIGEALAQMREAREATQERPGTPQGPTKDFAGRQALRSEMTALWADTGTGKEFMVAAQVRGYQLAQGDRRAFVLVTPEGDVHALPRLIEGARTADVRAKLADIDPQGLPTIAQAKAMMALRGVKQAATRRADPARPSSDRPGSSSEQVIEGRIPPKDQLKGSGAADIAAGVAGKAAEVMGDIASGIAGLFAPEGPPTPEAIETSIDKAQRIEAERPRLEALSKAEQEEAERLAAIQKAQATMEAELRGDQDDRDRDDEHGIERTR